MPVRRRGARIRNYIYRHWHPLGQCFEHAVSILEKEILIAGIELPLYRSWCRVP